MIEKEFSNLWIDINDHEVLHINTEEDQKKLKALEIALKLQEIGFDANINAGVVEKYLKRAMPDKTIRRLEGIDSAYSVEIDNGDGTGSVFEFDSLNPYH